MKNSLITLMLLLAVKVSAYPLFTGSLTNFFGSAPGRATFTAGGYTVAGSSNVISVALDDTNIIFTSVPTTGAGGQWTLSGAIEFDGTNLNCSVQYVSDDVSNRIGSAFTTVTNGDTSPTFAITEDDGLINMVLTHGVIAAGQSVPPFRTPMSIDLVAPPATRIQKGLGTPTNVILTCAADAPPTDDTLVLILNGIPIRDLDGAETITSLDVLACAVAAGQTLKYGDQINVADRDNNVINWSTPAWTVAVQWDDGGTNFYSGGTNATGASDPVAPSYHADGFFILNRPQPQGGGGGGSAGITNFVLTVTNLPAGSDATVTNTGVIGGIAYIQIGVPAGAPGTNSFNTTNTVTVQQFTNVWLSSQEKTTYTTNFAFWGGSNYLARVNGYYKGLVGLGTDGGNPPFSIPGALLGSLNGSNGWFPLTNGFTTTNFITVVETNSPGLVTPGSAILYSVDHLELLGRTNYGFGQHYRFENPFDANDPATKGYADNLFANAFNNNWSSYTSNGLFHFIYSYQNQTVVDIASTTVWLPVFGGSLDGTGTNFLMTIYQTNMTPVYIVQSSTNLALVAGFTTFTNYSVATNSGVVTFTIPINFTEPMRFFRVISSSSSSSMAVNVPLTLNAGVFYPSNSWNLSDITNRLAAFGSGKHYWTGSSNGLALVTLSYSNGVVRYVRSDQ